MFAAMSSTSKITIRLALAVCLIGIAGYACIHVGGLEPKVVAPWMGFAVAISVGVFARFYNAALKREATQAVALPAPSFPVEQQGTPQNKGAANEVGLNRRSRLIVLFVAVLVLIAIIGFDCIFVRGMPQAVADPLIGLLIVTSVTVFVSQHNDALSKQSISPVAPAIVQSEDQASRFRFVRILAYVMICLTVAMTLMFLIEAWLGVLNPSAVRSFVPKGVFLLFLVHSAFQKTRIRS
jgi:hypothetical protein